MKRYYSEDEPLTVLPELDQPLLHSNLATEIKNLQLAESWQRRTGRSSKTLLNSPACGILLIAMKQNTETKEHRVDGKAIIHTLVGRLRLKLPDRTVELPAGHLLMLDHGITHDVYAVDVECLPTHHVLARGTCQICSEQLTQDRCNSAAYRRIHVRN